MFATIKQLIPEPRQADQPRHYVGRHRRADPAPPVPVSPAPIITAPPPTEKPAEETTAA
jgi:hypothetical protein